MARLPLAMSLLMAAPVATTRLEPWNIRLVPKEHVHCFFQAHRQIHIDGRL